MLQYEKQRIKKQVWQIVSEVPDPEIPVVTIEDLGILRNVQIENDGEAIVELSPTYSGCPAITAIEIAVSVALQQAGLAGTIKRVLSPAWSSDWITETGRNKLLAYGIAPPATAKEAIACPQCRSVTIEKISQFGSTSCKALYRCLNCREPFDYFKCL